MVQGLLKNKLAKVFQGKGQKPKKKKYKFFLCLDIGSEAVKALILGSSLDKKTVVFAAGLEYFDRYDIFDSQGFKTDKIKEVISQAVKKAHDNLSFSLLGKEIKKKIQNQRKWLVLLGLPPDVLKARVVSQFFLREEINPAPFEGVLDPFKRTYLTLTARGGVLKKCWIKTKISEKEKKLIYDQVFESAKKEISQEFAKKSGILAKDIHWISLKTTELRIDGYPVSGLKGYQGRELEFRILATFLAQYYWQSIQKAINSLGFEIFKTVHLAEPLSFLCRSKKRNGIFLDVGGEITQIFKIKNSKIDRIDEFENGARPFIQSLSQKLGTDKETARDFGRKYSIKRLTPETSARIKELLSEDKRTWQNDLEAKLRKMNPKDTCASVVFLLGGGSYFPEIQEALLAKEDAGQGFPVLNRPKIRFIRLRDLEIIKDLTKKLNNPQYMPSLLLTLTLYNG